MSHKIKLSNDDLKQLIAVEHDLSEIIDVEKVFNKSTDKDRYPTNGFLMPEYPFKLVICGPSNCGKSVLVLNMIFKFLVYDTITIIGETVTQQAKYKIFSDLAELFPEKFKMMPTVGKLKMKKYNKDLTNIVLIDDCQECSKSDEKTFNELFTLGRHYNINSIFLSQDYYKTGIRCRANTTHFIFFKINSQKQINRIHKELAAELTKSEFLALFIDATQNDNEFSFLLIDTTAKSKEMRYRKGLIGYSLISQ
jgi:hypothetical protein